MDSLIEFGIGFILWLQGFGSWLTAPSKVFTFLGNEEFYLLVAPAILWCLDAKLGLRLGLFLMINGMFKGAFKLAFHSPRPYWYSSNVKVFGVPDSSFGIPSGHSMDAVVGWGTLASWIRKSWAWVIALLLMFLIGLSRLYLAVHFPHDVLIGWLIGALILALLLRFERPVVSWLKRFTPAGQILIAFLFSLLSILMILLVILSLSAWVVPDEWLSNARLAFPDEPDLNPVSIYSQMASPGAFFGLAAGWIWLNTRGGFTVKDVWWKLILRYLLGLVGMLVLYVGLGSVFPKGEALIAIVLRYLRYALIGFWAAGLAPWLFVKLNLAQGSGPD